MDIRQGEFGLGELGLQNRCSVEVEQRGAVGAVGHILGWVLLSCDCCVWLVKALTVIHHMHGVEVMDAEVACNVGCHIVDERVDVTFDAIYEGRQEAAIPVGGVE